MLRAINTAGLSEIEKRVVKATYDDFDPPKAKHVESLVLLSADHDLLQFLDKRIISPQWNICFKSLILMHKILQEGNPRFFSELLEVPSILELPQQFDSFGDIEASIHAKFINFYAKYLTLKISSYRELNISIERFPTNQAKKWSKKLNNSQLIKTITILQTQFTAILKLSPKSSEEQQSPITISAMTLIIKDAFRLYSILTLLMMLVLEHYDSMNLVQTETILLATQKFILQNKKFRQWSNLLAKINFVQKQLLPDFDAIPETFLQLLEEHIISLGGNIENPTIIKQERIKREKMTGKNKNTKKSPKLNRAEHEDFEEETEEYFEEEENNIRTTTRKSPQVARQSNSRSNRQTQREENEIDEEIYEEQKTSRTEKTINRKTGNTQTTQQQLSSSASQPARRPQQINASAEYEARASRQPPPQQPQQQQLEYFDDAEENEFQSAPAKKQSLRNSSIETKSDQPQQRENQQKQPKPPTRHSSKQITPNNNNYQNNNYSEEDEDYEQHEHPQSSRAPPPRRSPPASSQPPPQPQRNSRAAPQRPLEPENDFFDGRADPIDANFNESAEDLLSMFAPPTPMGQSQSQSKSQSSASSRHSAPLTSRSRAAARAAIQSGLNSELNLFEDFDPTNLHPAEEEAINRQQQEINNSLAFFGTSATTTKSPIPANQIVNIPLTGGNRSKSNSSVPATPPPRYEQNLDLEEENIFEDLPTKQSTQQRQQRTNHQQPRAAQSSSSSRSPRVVDSAAEFSDPFSDLSSKNLAVKIDPKTFQPVIHRATSQTGGVRRTKAQAAADAAARVPRKKPVARADEDEDFYSEEENRDDYT